MWVKTATFLIYNCLIVGGGSIGTGYDDSGGGEGEVCINRKCCKTCEKTVKTSVHSFKISKAFQWAGFRLWQVDSGCLMFDNPVGDDLTYTLSVVTFRMSITSHSPEVMAVALPCMNTEYVWVVNMSQKMIHKDS